MSIFIATTGRIRTGYDVLLVDLMKQENKEHNFVFWKDYKNLENIDIKACIILWSIDENKTLQDLEMTELRNKVITKYNGIPIILHLVHNDKFIFPKEVTPILKALKACVTSYTFGTSS